MNAPGTKLPKLEMAGNMLSAAPDKIIAAFRLIGSAVPGGRKMERPDAPASPFGNIKPSKPEQF
ncbi:hypothetical protein AZE99_03685 [Sphingorhabdus sp. M41]|nr:hypothetical protein AZE99_03685 [Sphingorhabdus sp. M41]